MQTEQSIKTTWTDDMVGVIEDDYDLNVLDRLKAAALMIGAASAVCQKDVERLSSITDQINACERSWESIASLLTSAHCKLMELETTIKDVTFRLLTAVASE